MLWNIWQHRPSSDQQRKQSALGARARVIRRTSALAVMFGGEKERNRVEVPGLPKAVETAISKHLRDLERQAKDLERMMLDLIKAHSQLREKRDY